MRRNNFIIQNYLTEQTILHRKHNNIRTCRGAFEENLKFEKKKNSQNSVRELRMESCRWILLGSALPLLILVSVALGLTAYFGGFAAGTDKSGLRIGETDLKRSVFDAFLGAAISSCCATVELAVSYHFCETNRIFGCHAVSH